ncbi:MAG: DUF4832 domain-containing protein [Planctomycetota bacterium]|nr:DUF4832 domain-containing protein [Planctomycetota bacterium]
MKALKVTVGRKLQELLMLCYFANTPVLLIGPSGIGKTEIVERTAKELGIGCCPFDTTITDPVDLIGLPLINGATVRYVPPEILPTSGNGLLFLDELNRARREMLNASLQLICSRRLNTYHLPPGWLPLGAMNPSDDENYDTNRLDIAMLSRFVRVEVEADPEHWVSWAEGNGVHPSVVSYVRATPGVFNKGAAPATARARRLPHAPSPPTTTSCRLVLARQARCSTLPLAAPIHVRPRKEQGMVLVHRLPPLIFVVSLVAGAAETPEAGLVGHWKLDDGKGASAQDSSGNGNHGVLKNMDAAKCWVQGKSGGALDFDGETSYVEIPNSTALQSVQDGSYTLVAWFNPAALPPGKDWDYRSAYGIVMKKGFHEGFMYDKAGRFTLCHWLAGDKGAGTATWDTFAPGQFHHVAGVLDKAAGEARLYVNGMLNGRASYDARAAARTYGVEPWRIGTGNSNTHEGCGWPAKGVISDVRIYDRVLSDEDIRKLAGAAGGAQRVVVTPKDHGKALLNPGMGWNMPYYTDNGDNHYGGKLAPDDQLEWFPGCTAVSFRVGWGRIETKEGQFDWDYTDKIAERWVAKGRQVVYCWLVFSTIGSVPCTPAWVRDAGAKGWEYRKKDPYEVPCWVPNWDDPVFMQKLENFIRAAAERYDGKPHVAFVEIGSLGTWGEGHSWAPGGGVPAISLETKKKHIDLWRKHFRKTPLTVNDDYLDEAVKYAQQQGCGLADWSVMVEGGGRAYFHQNFAQWFWPEQIVTLENEHYHYAMQKKTWGDGSKYLDAVEDYHASWARIHGWPDQFLKGDEKEKLPGNKELVDRMNLRLGYRLQVLRATWDVTAKAGEKATFHIKWRNAGVAPCYGGGLSAITIKDAAGAIVATSVDTVFSVRALQPGRPADQAPPQDAAVAVALPATLPAGPYKVFVSVGDKDGRAVIALPHDGDDGQRRYPLGELKVTP